MADTLTLDSTVYTCTVGECFLYLINVNSSDQNELAGALTLTGASSTFVVLTIPAITFLKATWIKLNQTTCIYSYNIQSKFG